MIHFITNDRRADGEVGTILAGLDVTFMRRSLPTPRGASLEERAIAQVEAAHLALGEACLVELAELRLSGDVAVSRARFGERRAREPNFVGSHTGPAESVIAVAYTDGASTQIFVRRLGGTLVDAPRGSGGIGWDAWLVPDGCDRTSAELAEDGAFVTERLTPHIELSDHLGGRTYGGVFEAHITVQPMKDEELARFVVFCQARGVKPIYIELARGVARSQPMTGSYHHGELPAVRAEIRALSRALRDAGFVVAREKIEATGANRDIPQGDAEARETPDNYFEYHVKVTLPPGVDTSPLTALAVEHGAHLSRNARKVRPDGGSDRFVTLRVYDGGKATADARFAGLREALGAAGHAMAKPICEYTVYDTNLAVDDGWLPDKS